MSSEKTYPVSKHTGVSKIPTASKKYNGFISVPGRKIIFLRLLSNSIIMRGKIAIAKKNG